MQHKLLKCIDDKRNDNVFEVNLTAGKLYTIQRMNDTHVYVIDDKGQNTGFYISRFKEIDVDNYLKETEF